MQGTHLCLAETPQSLWFSLSEAFSLRTLEHRACHFLSSELTPLAHGTFTPPVTWRPGFLPPDPKRQQPALAASFGGPCLNSKDGAAQIREKLGLGRTETKSQLTGETRFSVRKPTI